MIKRACLHITLGLLALLCCLPLTARAASSDPAAAHLAAAKQAFQSQDYNTAAEALQKAYAVEPRSLYLFNAAQAYRKGERYKDALDLYEKFLQTDPDNRLAPEAKGYVADLKALLATKAQAEKIQIELQSEQAAKQQIAQQLEQARKPPFYKRAAFWGPVGAAVAVALIVGVTVLGVQAYQAKQIESDYAKPFTVNF